MKPSFYLDTCVWRDFYEDRIDRKGRRLGTVAARLFLRIIRRQETICYSELVVKELARAYPTAAIEEMFRILATANVLKRVPMTKEQYEEATGIAQERSVPVPDALHAILAREAGAVFVSQDRHAQLLKDIVTVKKPEELTVPS